MIIVIDYGLGNIQAFCNIYNRLGIETGVGRTIGELSKASKLILPGVGAFDWAMTLLNKSGMRDYLEKLVIDQGVPVLGVCVGMQMMANRSEEGVSSGLGWIDGEVKRFKSGAEDIVGAKRLPLPHMGWNSAKVVRDNELFTGLSESNFYFLHSYYFKPKNYPDVITETDYGDHFASSVSKNSIYGVQFHPEKSHFAGIQLLKNFATI